MRCAGCGREYREGRKFCTGCGAPLVVACPACGAPTLAPALCEWRAELAAELGDAAASLQVLREAQQLYAEIGAPAHVSRLAQDLGS